MMKPMQYLKQADEQPTINSTSSADSPDIIPSEYILMCRLAILIFLYFSTIPIPYAWMALSVGCLRVDAVCCDWDSSSLPYKRARG